MVIICKWGTSGARYGKGSIREDMIAYGRMKDVVCCQWLSADVLVLDTPHILWYDVCNGPGKGLNNGSEVSGNAQSEGTVK